jgi:hypothetical protein
MSAEEEIAHLRQRLETAETVSETRRIALTLIGMSDVDAAEVARDTGRTLRIMGRDPMTLDFVHRRITLVIENGAVGRASAG